MIKKVGVVILALGVAAAWVGISHAVILVQQAGQNKMSQKPAANTGVRAPDSQTSQQPGAQEEKEKPRLEAAENPVTVVPDPIRWNPCGEELKELAHGLWLQRKAVDFNPVKDRTSGTEKK